MEGRLVLEDGAVFRGKAVGSQGEHFGEVIFFTGMTGYQEAITDPSYFGFLLTMTYPLIGNYGVNSEDFESDKPSVKGIITREICSEPNNWRTEEKLEDLLSRYGIIALTEVDTRALTRHLREKGAMKGIITALDTAEDALIAKMNGLSPPSSQDLVRFVTTTSPYTLEAEGPTTVVIDLGLKRSIARSLNRAGFRVQVVPAGTTAGEVLAQKPDGVIFSNGPGGPDSIPYVIDTARRLIGKCPLLGICLGHLVLARALGLKVKPLKLGHYGFNQPVKNLRSGKVQITVQSHRFAVEEESLRPEEVTVTHRNVNDGTIEGFSHRHIPLLGVQFHPEPYPAVNRGEHIYEIFMKKLQGGVKDA